MDLKDIAKMVIDVAPAIGGALAIPTGGASVAAAVAVKALGAVFGLGDDAKPEQIADAIKADPEYALKLKAADQLFALEMRKQDNIELAAILADKANARNRDVSIRQTGKLNVRADVLLVAAFIAVIAIYAVCALFGESKIGQLVIGSMLTTAGLFVQKIGTAFDFEFGSSRGDLQKTELLAKAQPIKE
jgi:hypothetical protein